MDLDGFSSILLIANELIANLINPNTDKLIENWILITRARLTRELKTRKLYVKAKLKATSF